MKKPKEVLRALRLTEAFARDRGAEKLALEALDMRAGHTDSANFIFAWLEAAKVASEVVSDSAIYIDAIDSEVDRESRRRAIANMAYCAEMLSAIAAAAQTVAEKGAGQ